MAVTGVSAAPPAVVAKPPTATAKRPANPSGGAAAPAATTNPPPATRASGTKPPDPAAILQARRAQYMKSGIDKDAAIGDPDRDAPRRIVANTGVAAQMLHNSAAKPGSGTTPRAATAAYQAASLVH